MTAAELIIKLLKDCPDLSKEIRIGYGVNDIAFAHETVHKIKDVHHEVILMSEEYSNFDKDSDD